MYPSHGAAAVLPEKDKFGIIKLDRQFLPRYCVYVHLDALAVLLDICFCLQQVLGRMPVCVWW